MAKKNNNLDYELEKLIYQYYLSLVKETLGNHIFENLLHVKRKEWDTYRLQVTKWELDNYLPLL
jgi:glutamine synthetase